MLLRNAVLASIVTLLTTTTASAQICTVLSNDDAPTTTAKSLSKMPFRQRRRRRTMRWIMATLMNASLLSTVRSYSFDNRRDRPSQPNVRSTTHRFGWTTNPRWPASFARPPRPTASLPRRTAGRCRSASPPTRP